MWCFLPLILFFFPVLPCGFFFSSRRRHRRCDRDWSSDVCSSDLATASGQTVGSLTANRDFWKQTFQASLSSVMFVGSVKRVASGVGEGSVAISFVHQYLSKVV